MNIFEVGAKLGLNSKDFVNGLKTASSSMSSFASKTKDVLGGVAKAGTVAFGAITAAAGTFTGALIKGVGEISTYGDNIDKMSQKMGLSAQAYQEWDAVMQHSGTSMESLKASIKTLSNAVEKGNEAFERLGISQEELTTLNTEQLFERTISALQGVENTTERTYLASQLLGRGATELGALLNTSAEDTEKMRKRVHELGGVMSDEAVKAAAKYRDSIQDMKTAFAGMGRGLLSDFIPAMTEVSDGLAAIFAGEDNGAELFMKGFDDVLSNISNSVSKLKPIVKKIGGVVIEVVPQIIQTMAQGILKSAPKLLEVGKELLKNLTESLENADFDLNNNLLTKLLGSIIDNAPAYFEYAQRIITNIANRLLDVDYGALASNLSSVFVSAVNSITDFVKSIDFYKVGENIADFINNIDWQEVANSIFDLLGAAIKAIPDIAVSFFANADLGNLITGIGLLAGPKLLGGIGDFFGGSEGQSLIGATGTTWAGAFMTAIKAFGLGWAIGSYLRDNIEFGGKTLGEWVDTGMEKFFGDNPETDDDFNTSLNTGYIVRNGQVITIDPTQNPEMYKKYNPQAYERWYKEYGSIAKKAGFDVPTPFANGGRVTQPTLAIIGEKEPETVVPDSKKSEFGNTINYNITMNVDGYNIKNDEEFIEILSRKLSELSVRQQRAMGGAGWK